MFEWMWAVQTKTVFGRVQVWSLRLIEMFGWMQSQEGWETERKC